MSARLNYGRFADHWRGDGCFASVIWARGWLLLAVRWRWRFAVVRAATGALRVYVGPIEIERYRTEPAP